MSDSRPRIDRLVDQLQKLADPNDPNRAVLAHLRKGLGTDPCYALSRAGWLFSGFDERADEEAAILTAGLFAWAKGKCAHSEHLTLGRAFAKLPGAGENPSIERRFIDLLDTDQVDLDFKLRQVVSLLAQHNIGLDWGLLCWHLIQWPHPDRWVQKVWARDFWRFATSESDSTSQTEIIDSSSQQGA